MNVRMRRRSEGATSAGKNSDGHLSRPVQMTVNPSSAGVKPWLSAIP
jgi:hypothetical protein